MDSRDHLTSSSHSMSARERQHGELTTGWAGDEVEPPSPLSKAPSSASLLGGGQNALPVRSAQDRPGTRDPTTTNPGRANGVVKEHTSPSRNVHEKSTGHGEKRVTFDQTVGGRIDDEYRDPLRMSETKKWILLLITATCSLCVTCTSSVVASTYTGIQQSFNISHEVAILGLTIFVCGLATGPLLLAPFSEFYGRRPVYIAAFTAFFLVGFPVAFANHAAIFFVFRYLSGFVGSAFLSVAGGTVSDMWTGTDTFLPMATYTASPFLGPVLGPVLSGFIVQYAGAESWRWTFRVMIIWSAVQLIFILFVMPETFAPKILMLKARRIRRETGDDSYYAEHERMLQGKSLGKTIAVSSSRIFQLLALEPMLALLCLWCAILLGILYLFFELFPIVFGKHNFSQYQDGLSFLGIGLGMVLALAVTPFFAARLREREKRGGGTTPPEALLDMAKVGAITTPVGLYIFAFTSYANVHWIAPIIGSVPFGFGVQCIYTSVFTYTTDNWRPVAASAMGANGVTRSCFAAVFPLFAEQMAQTLGTVGAGALLASLNVIIVPLPFVFARYGPQLRARSRFALS